MDNLILTTCDQNLFDKYKDRLWSIDEHYEGCRYSATIFPMNECPCDCYLKTAFMIGREAERSLPYAADRK